MVLISLEIDGFSSVLPIVFLDVFMFLGYIFSSRI